MTARPPEKVATGGQGWPFGCPFSCQNISALGLSIPTSELKPNPKPILRREGVSDRREVGEGFWLFV